MNCRATKDCPRQAIAYVTAPGWENVPACRECGLAKQVDETNRAQQLGVSPQFQLDEITKPNRPAPSARAE